MSNSSVFKTELSDEDIAEEFIFGKYPFAGVSLAGLQSATCVYKALPDGSFLIKFVDGSVQRQIWQDNMVVELNT